MNRSLLTPLPARLAALLPLNAVGNPSLLFDRGVDRYEEVRNRRTREAEGWRIPAGEKEKFLRAFADAFNRRGANEYRAFLARRSEVMEKLNAYVVDLSTRSRLAIGLGLASPIETGFLFDRLTGCPHLPGSSVKGLLRAAARWVQRQELAGDGEFWQTHFARIFGPEIEPGAIAQTGSAVFYDAFPLRWPALEVDVLTPHYQQYYGNEGEFPADWDNPVPVPFLTVRAGEAFRFSFQAPEGDRAQLTSLLVTALDWLGIGAKKSAGYGVFAAGAPGR